MEDVRQLVRDDGAKPLFGTAFQACKIGDVYPDVRIAVADGDGKAVRDFVLIGEIDVDLSVELRLQVRCKCGIACLRDRRRFDFDACEPSRIHDPEVRGLCDLPLQLGMVSAAQNIEALGLDAGRWEECDEECDEAYDEWPDHDGRRSRSAAEEVLLVTCISALD